MGKAKNIELKELVRIIKKSKNVLIATHENPDGDGIGSILALAAGLRQLGKKVNLFIKDPVPKMYQYLPNWKTIKTTLPKNGKWDLSFIVDLGELERVGQAFIDHPGRALTVSLDHHAQGNHNADLNFCLPKQASSGEVIFKVLKALKVKLNNAMATGIYTAMVTDTGSFKYSNTTKESFQIATELMEYKVDTWKVALNCFETSSLERMELLKKVIGSMEIHKNRKVAWIVLKQSDYKKTGATADDAEGFINYPRSIEGVEVAIAFKETGKDQYKISLRSKNYVNVSKVASLFDGGGHIRAAGCKMKGPLPKVQKALMSAIINELK